MVSPYLTITGMKSIIKQYLFIWLGIVIVGYIISIRLLINKLPRELPTIVSWIEFCIYSLVPLCFLFLAIALMIGPKKTQKTLILMYLSKFLNILSKFYWKSLLALDSIIKQKIPSEVLGYNLLRFAKIYADYYKLNNKKLFIKTFILFSFIPKYLFLLILIYDVFYLKMFNYIYYYAWLLLIPVAFNYLLFTLKEFFSFNLNHYIHNVFLVIDDNNLLVEDVDIILDSCTKVAFNIFHFNEKNVIFDSLYGNISESYLKENHITDYREAESVKLLRYNEFVLFRLGYTQMVIFNLIRETFNTKLNVFYFLCLALVWLYVLIRGLGYIS